jgi:hypothetical protein
LESAGTSGGALRGRIKHFQRLGISPRRPGKGRTIDYETKDVLRWAIALEFAEFGIDPTIIKPALHLAETVLAERQDQHDENVWLVFTTHLMSHPADRGRWFHGMVALDPAQFFADLAKGSLPGGYNPRRLGIIDVGRLKRALDRGLDPGSAN